MKKNGQDQKTVSRNVRVQLIKKIEEFRSSKVITYLTSTRPGLDTPMAFDVVRYIYDHLEKIKSDHDDNEKNKLKIDLFIYSNGGDGTVPWRLVTLIREYTNHFSVIVPYRAFSAATLTALGANEIIMHPMGVLGPTDPSVTNHFNPTNQAGQPLPISVEDVTAYIQLIKEDAGIQHEDELVQLVKILAEKIHPLALGNVKRSISQSRMMAFKLLKLHMPKNDEHKIQEIADNLTSKLFYHGHPINRKEAKEQVGLTTVIDAKPDLEKVIWDLYLEYEKSLKLVTPFNATAEFTKQFPELEANKIQVFKPGKEKLVYIESTYDCDIASVDIQLVGTKQQNGLVSVIPVYQPLEWSKSDT